MSTFNGDYSNSGTEWSPRGGRSGYRGGNSGGWGRGRGRGSGGRWASPGEGQGPYDHPRPPPLHSREGVWGTGDRRHSDSLAPGSSLVDGLSSNRHSSGNGSGSTSSYRRGGGGSGEGGEGGASSSPSTGGKKRTPDSVNHNDNSSNSVNYKRLRNHSGSPSGGGDGGERKVVSGRGDGNASKKSPGSSSSNNNDNNNYNSNNMKWNRLGKRKNGSRGKSGQKGEENVVLLRREAKLKVRYKPLTRSSRTSRTLRVRVPHRSATSMSKIMAVSYVDAISTSPCYVFASFFSRLYFSFRVLMFCAFGRGVSISTFTYKPQLPPLDAQRFANSRLYSRYSYICAYGIPTR